MRDARGYEERARQQRYATAWLHGRCTPSSLERNILLSVGCKRVRLQDTLRLGFSCKMSLIKRLIHLELLNFELTTQQTDVRLRVLE